MCRDRPDVQVLLDEAVQGKHGGDRKSENINVDNIHVDMNIAKKGRPTGTSHSAGLRKLRKHSESNPEAAEYLDQVLDKKISVNQALVKAGLHQNKRSLPNIALCPNKRSLIVVFVFFVLKNRVLNNI